MSAAPIRLERNGAVAVITIDNPPVNEMGNALLAVLADELRGLASSQEIRVVVITGAGSKAFAAGASLKEFARMLGSPEAVEEHTMLAREAFDAIEQLPQPVVAAVQAAAIGGGLELALACDLVVADERAKLGLPETGLGLIPGAGGTQRLPRRLGLARATALIMLGSRIGAEEAQRLGLVHVVAASGDCVAQAMALARTLAERPQLALRAAKRVMRAGAHLPLAEALDLEREAFISLLSSEDARAGVSAFVAGETPQFNHR